MPMMLPNKKITSIIIGKMDAPKGEQIEEQASSTSDYEIALESAADDIFVAIESKNVKLFVSAMKDFHSIYDEEMEHSGYGEQEEQMEKGE